jgi:hypothetical protein
VIVDSAPPNPNPVVFARGFLGAVLSKFSSDGEQYNHPFLTPIVEFLAKLYFWLSNRDEVYGQLKREFFEKQVRSDHNNIAKMSISVHL